VSRDSELVALVTGAAGFAGHHLIDLLESETSWKIVGLSRQIFPSEGRWRVVACDMRDRELLGRVMSRYRPSYIFHLAAQSYVPKAFADPASTLVNNVVGQVNLFESVLSHDLSPRILIVSSSEIYGSGQEANLPLDEASPLRPANPYAVSKASQDLLAYQYSMTSPLEIVTMRPFNHTGPGQSDRFVISSFARQVAEAEAGKIEPSVLVGNLDAERDFSDVRDIARAYLLAMESGEPGEAYNLASGVPRRVGDLLDQLVTMSSRPLAVRTDPARLRPSDVRTIYGDSGKFRKISGWEPQIPIEKTLSDTLDYWRRMI
jgi:GDP-4-dehydro-6-deoxy-D-mannose reductase